MIAQERHRQIVSRIGYQGSARVSDLARLFDVTDETIRRDLRVLSQQGRLIRTHGGALVSDLPNAPDSSSTPGVPGTPGSHIDLPFDVRSSGQQQQKQAIAARAAGLIQPREVIALDASSTVCELARQLPDIPLTVVTNSLAVCSILARRSQIEAVCTGGVLDAEAMAFVGMQAEKALEFFNISKFFFSCRGIDLDRGVSEANDRQAALKLRLIGLARQSILLADTSKFGVASSVFYTPAESIDQLITDNDRTNDTDEVIQTLRNRGVQVERAELRH